jgi:hypothetical protein
MIDMKMVKSKTRPLRLAGISLLATLPIFSVIGCGGQSPHQGRLPFSLAEKPPAGSGTGAMTIALEHRHSDGPPSADLLASIRPGDVIAFHMSHDEAWSYLRKGNIQKVPYELFRYGHIALVVPAPDLPAGSGELRLLQIAMKQAANAADSLDYLKDKSWIVYRPPSGSVDPVKLREFTRRAVVSAGDPKTAYDYRGALGVRNAPCEPSSFSEIGGKYSCATLVVAGLHYSGYPLDALHRGGRFDIVTPRQVVESSRR